MPDTNEYNEIKAGVEGILSDVPEPTGETETITQEAPETNYAETTNYSAPTEYQEQNYGKPQGTDMERVHEIIEAIISEKWEEMISRVGNLAVWKEKTNNDIVSIKQEIIRTQENFRVLQNAVLGRVKDYDQGIRNVSTEMKALEKVFEKILEPLTSNIKELGRLTQELKTIKR